MIDKEYLENYMKYTASKLYGSQVDVHIVEPHIDFNGIGSKTFVQFRTEQRRVPILEATQQEEALPWKDPMGYVRWKVEPAKGTQIPVEAFEAFECRYGRGLNRIMGWSGFLDDNSTKLLDKICEAGVYNLKHFDEIQEAQRKREEEENAVKAQMINPEKMTFTGYKCQNCGSMMKLDRFHNMTCPCCGQIYYGFGG